MKGLDTVKPRDSYIIIVKTLERGISFYRYKLNRKNRKYFFDNKNIK